MDDATFAKQLARARKTNARRDQYERKSGFAAVTDCAPWQIVATARMALMAGIQVHDESCLFEAYAMLEDVERQLIPAELRKESGWPTN